MSKKTDVKRREFVFIHECETCNPNGDPLRGNEPRFDEETQTIWVSDERYKRNIRDTWKDWGNLIWIDYIGEEAVTIDKRMKILMIQTGKKQTLLGNQEEGEIDWDTLIKDVKLKTFPRKNLEEALFSCIDVRVFGAVLSIKNINRSYVGPVQFTWGKSLHPARIISNRGTTRMTSNERSKQGTFRLDSFVPYAIIGTSGTVNPYNAQKTGMTENDFLSMRKALWSSYLHVSSRTKVGQSPLLWIEVISPPDKEYYIGNLHRHVLVKTHKPEPASLNDVTIDLTPLVSVVPPDCTIEVYVHKKVVDGVDFGDIPESNIHVVVEMP